MTPRTSCIVRPPEDRLLIVRASYVRILEGDHCAAGLLSVFEFWANGDIASAGTIQPRQVTLRELSTALMGSYKERAIGSALDKLRRLGLQ